MKENNLAESSRRSSKWLYCIGAIGPNVTWMLVSSFLTIYYTNCAQINPLFIGNMMLFCRFFDGITDVIAGSIIDKTNMKLGKARPWMIITAIPLIVSFILMFTVPSGLDTAGKQIYAAVTYFIFTAVFYTINNIAFQALLPRFSPTSQDRVTISSMRTVFAYISILAVNMLTTVLLGQRGGMTEQGAWTFVVLIFGILSLVSLIFPCFVKETVALPEKKDEQKTVPLKDSIKVLLSSRYFYICLFLFLTYYITNGVGSAGIYFATYVVGNANVYGIISLASMLPSIVVMPFVPKLFKKMGKRNAMRSGLVLAAVSSLAILINPSNVALYSAMSILKSVGTLPMVAALFTLAGDVVDYNEMKTGIRTEGLSTSANGIGQKLGSGLGSAFLGWILFYSNFDQTSAVQPDSALTAITFLMVILPIIIFAISFVLVSFWDLEKYQDEIIAFRKSKKSV